MLKTDTTPHLFTVKVQKGRLWIQEVQTFRTNPFQKEKDPDAVCVARTLAKHHGLADLPKSCFRHPHRGHSETVSGGVK